jgi:hypothetical protein
MFVVCHGWRAAGRATGGGQFGRFDRGYDYDDFGNLRGNDHCGGHGASNDSTENLLQLIQPERQAQHEILAKNRQNGKSRDNQHNRTVWNYPHGCYDWPIGLIGISRFCRNIGTTRNILRTGISGPFLCVHIVHMFTIGLERLAGPWRAAGGRAGYHTGGPVASGWRARGERLAGPWRAAGGPVASGWRTGRIIGPGGTRGMIGVAGVIGISGRDERRRARGGRRADGKRRTNRQQ